MIDKPIIFSAPMVKAILAGRKTQTRRLLRWPAWTGYAEPHRALPDGCALYCWDSSENFLGILRAEWHGRLWVKETFVSGTMNGDAERRWVRYRATDEADVPVGTRWRPSIFMPRWASRIQLEVQEVRVQRLQDISESDSEAEGVQPERSNNGLVSCPARGIFAGLWNDINGDRASWDENPWVAALTFRVVEAPSRPHA